MNTIKYINPLSLERKSGKILQQRRWATITAPLKNNHFPSLRELDEHMASMGFIRAGKRWATALARAALKAAV